MANDATDDLFIIDTAATVSCVTTLRLLATATLTKFEADEIIRIEGISGHDGLISPASGNLHGPSANTRCLYVPEAASNILSWWDIRNSHRIDLEAQDTPDEHLLLTCKTSGVKVQCFIDPVLHMYVYRPAHPGQPTPRIYSLSHVRKLQQLGHNKKAAVRAARVQDLHESLGFCHPAVVQ